MTVTSGFLTALECNKLVFGRGSAPDLAGGAYLCSPDTLAGLRESTSKGTERGKWNGREGEGPPPLRKFLDPTLPTGLETKMFKLTLNRFTILLKTIRNA